jgi:hypothetical protein
MQVKYHDPEVIKKETPIFRWLEGLNRGKQANMVETGLEGLGRSE